MVTKYRINPNVVDVIAFCTKNPAPMLPHLDVLKPYGQYWFVTITPYGKEIEPNVPDKKQVIEDFKTLSKAIGINCVGWRYDPVFITDKYSLDFHLQAFEKMAKELSGYTNVCIISFIDLYKKVIKNFPQARAVTKDERIKIGKAFAQIGKKYGITIKACAEGDDLKPYGVDCDGCLTKSTYENALQTKINLPKRKGQRNECACFFGNDIGSYDTCKHLCKYCYANTNPSEVIKNSKLHNPNSPFLIGTHQAGDKISEPRQESWIDNQLTLG
jgi:DNA repair photolyase